MNTMKSNLIRNKSNAIKTRQYWPDWLRGVCMFMVILSHISLTKLTHYSWFYSPVFLVVFFFVSGYFYKQYDNLGESLLHVWRKIVVPWFLLGLIVIIFSYTFFKSIKDGIWLEYLYGKFVRLIKGDSLWFLNCLAVTQVYYILLMKVCNKFFKNNLNLCKLIIAVVGLCAIFLLARRDRVWIWSADTALYALGWYALGNLCSSYSKKIELNGFISVLLLLTYILIVVIVNNLITIKYDMANNVFSHPLLQMTISLIGCFVLFQIALTINRNRTSRFVSPLVKFGLFGLLGKHTLVAFCFHSTIGFFIVRTLFHVMGINALVQYPYFYCLLFTYPVCWVMVGISWLLERYVPFVVGKERYHQQNENKQKSKITSKS